MSDEHAPSVIIRGHIFDYAEKAPFVKSGMSVLGALEYDPASEQIKCHECGSWFGLISNTHVREKHSISVAIYKFRHGINLGSPLCTPTHSAIMRRTNLTLNRDPSVIRKAREQRKPTEKSPVNQTVKRHHENDNLTGRCKVQTLFRLQMLAARLGRTPTHKELEHEKLGNKMIRHFGSIPSALIEAGLNIRERSTGGGNNKSDGSFKPGGGNLPPGFPSQRQLDDSRMPWPKEYFGVNAFERRLPS